MTARRVPGSRLICHLGRKHRERAAASSLLLIILLPTILLILAIFYEGACLRRDELDFTRLCEQRLNWMMADYNRELWRDFGLWGISEETLSDPKYEKLGRETMPAHHSYEIKSEIVRELSEPDYLKQQIQRQMSIRAPYLLGQDLYRHLREFRSGGQALLQDQWSDLTAPREYMDPEELLEKLPAEAMEETGGEPPPDSAESGTVPAELPGDSETALPSESAHSAEELQAAKAEALGLAAELIDGCKEILIPLYQSTGSDVPSRALEPGALCSIADFADRLLFAYDLPVISHLQIEEYIFNYFTSAVSGQIRNGRYEDLETPDGRKMTDLTGEGRIYEVESILFPSGSPERSAKEVKYRILAILFVVRLIKNARSKTKQTLYMVEATALSAAIAAASLGQVLIKPTYLKYLIMLVDSIQAADKDVKHVLAGRPAAIGFSDEGRSVPLYYRDFLRLFSFFYREETLLQNLDRVRQRTIPGRFVCAVRLHGTFRGYSLGMERAYGQHQP